MDKRIRNMCQEIDRQKKLTDAQEGVTEWAEKLLDENESLRQQLAAMRSILNEFDNPYQVGDTWQWIGPDPDEVDAAIDAAMKQEGE